MLVFSMSIEVYYLFHFGNGQGKVIMPNYMWMLSIF